MQIIKEVKDLLRDQLVDLWDGTWEREEDHRETFFNLGYWHDLVYKKQFGDYVVYVGCAGELNDFVTFIDVQRKGGSRRAWLETPDDGHGIMLSFQGVAAGVWGKNLLIPLVGSWRG